MRCDPVAEKTVYSVHTLVLFASPKLPVFIFAFFTTAKETVQRPYLFLVSHMLNEDELLSFHLYQILYIVGGLLEQVMELDEGFRI